MTIRDDLQNQISIRGIKSPFGRIAFDALQEITKLDKIVSDFGFVNKDKILLHSLSEASRCLGIAQEKNDKDAISHWSLQVENLINNGTIA